MREAITAVLALLFAAAMTSSVWANSGMVSEVEYRIFGDMDEAHQESDNLVCNIQGEVFLAQTFGGEWGIYLRVYGTEPGKHEAGLDYLTPPDRDGLREGRFTVDHRGSARGHAEIMATEERDGFGLPVMVVKFFFPEVELRRSGRQVGVEGVFRCGVI